MILAVTQLIPSSPLQPCLAWAAHPTPGHPGPARWAVWGLLSPQGPWSSNCISSRMDGRQRWMDGRAAGWTEWQVSEGAEHGQPQSGWADGQTDGLRGRSHSGEELSLSGDTAWVPTPALPLPSHVSLGKSHNLAVPQHPHLICKREVMMVPSHRVTVGRSEWRRSCVCTCWHHGSVDNEWAETDERAACLVSHWKV